MRLVKIISELVKSEEWIMIKTPYSEYKVISPRFLKYLLDKYKAYILSQDSVEYMLKCLPLHLHLVYNDETKNFGLYNKIQECYVKGSGSKTVIGCVETYLNSLNN
jgi:hypothetical protein